MSANDAKTQSSPEKRQSNGQFKKGLCPNPTGRPKGALAKKTKFLQIMTAGRQQRAMRVLDKELALAESGDVDARKHILALLQPFVKREVGQDGGGGGDKRPTVNVIVTQTDGREARLPPAVRVIDSK